MSDYFYLGSSPYAIRLTELVLAEDIVDVSVAGVRPHIPPPHQACLCMPLSLSWLLNGHFNGRDRGVPRDRQLPLLPVHAGCYAAEITQWSAGLKVGPCVSSTRHNLRVKNA